MGPEEGRGWLDRVGDGKPTPEAHGAATGLKTLDQPEPGPPDPLRESVPRDAAKGPPCPPPPVPASPPEGASLATPKRLAPAPPLKAQRPSPERGPEEPIPSGAPGGLGPCPPGPPTTPLSPHPAAQPPRSKAAPGPDQEPEVPPSAPRGPSPATVNPDSPGGTPVREQEGQAPEGHPERPQPADRKLCLSSLDTAPLPKGTACPSLQEATRLIREEFAFDGYLDNGLEALIMGTAGHGAPEKPQERTGCGGALQGEVTARRPPPVSAQGTGRAERSPPGQAIRPLGKPQPCGKRISEHCSLAVRPARQPLSPGAHRSAPQL